MKELRFGSARVRSILLSAIMGFLLTATQASALSRTQTRLAELLEQLTQTITKEMDYQKGRGTGSMALELRRLGGELVTEAGSISEAEARDAIGFEALRTYAISQPEGVIPVYVHNYRAAIAHAQLRLRAAGIDFIEIRQSPQAELSEDFRIWFKEKEKSPASLESLKAKSKNIYSLSSDSIIVLPVSAGPEITKANALLKEKNITNLSFKGDESLSRESEFLTPLSQPLTKHLRSYKKLSTTRNIVNPGLAWFGTWFGANFAPHGAISGVWPAFLEWQFSAFSGSFWAGIWSKWGFKASLVVNELYPTTSVAISLLVAAAFHASPKFDIVEFAAKTMIIGTSLFVSSFGAVQKASSRLLEEGEFSEHTRYRFETYSNFFNNFGRVLAIGAATLGIESTVFNFGDLGVHIPRLAEVGFNKGEIIGYAIQLVYLVGVTIPIWWKIKKGNALFDQQTKKIFQSAEMKNRIAQGKSFGTRCHMALGSIVRAYTFRRL